MASIDSTTLSTDQTKVAPQELPSADQLLTVSGKAPARAQRESEQGSRQARTAEFIISYADHLYGQALEKVPVAAEAGYGYTRIAAVRPPTKETDPDGERFYKYDAALTHWAGPGVDPSDGGMPLVMLLQGAMQRGSKVANPKLLPGGKTSADILRERLAPKKLGVQLVYMPKHGLCVFVIWNHAEWAKFTEQITARKEVATASRQTASASISVEEHERQQAAKKAALAKKLAGAGASAVAAADEWQTATKKRIGKPRPVSKE